MQFLADVVIRCPVCRGTRFRPEVLEVKYRGKSIADVLDMTAREGFSFFRHHPKAQARLRPLLDVGLDYLRLGQPVSTLSGGEAQRLKLSSRLATSMASIQRAATGPKTVFLMDEPTTGLHPADVSVLLDALNRLVDLGHSLILVEHSPEVMSAADWIIDLGPDAGPNGGGIVAAGTPERVAESGTATGKVLAGILTNESSRTGNRLCSIRTSSGSSSGTARRPIRRRLRSVKSCRTSPRRWKSTKRRPLAGSASFSASCSGFPRGIGTLLSKEVPSSRSRSSPLRPRTKPRR
jgi:excinuclease ABC subunit A